jgi:hypothetical protein
MKTIWNTSCRKIKLKILLFDFLFSVLVHSRLNLRSAYGVTMNGEAGSCNFLRKALRVHIDMPFSFYLLCCLETILWIVACNHEMLHIPVCSSARYCSEREGQLFEVSGLMGSSVCSYSVGCCMWRVTLRSDSLITQTFCSRYVYDLIDINEPHQ